MQCCTQDSKLKIMLESRQRSKTKAKIKKRLTEDSKTQTENRTRGLFQRKLHGVSSEFIPRAKTRLETTLIRQPVFQIVFNIIRFEYREILKHKYAVSNVLSVQFGTGYLYSAIIKKTACTFRYRAIIYLFSSFIVHTDDKPHQLTSVGYKNLKEKVKRKRKREFGKLECR